MTVLKSLIDAPPVASVMLAVNGSFILKNQSPVMVQKPMSHVLSPLCHGQISYYRS